MTYRLFFSVYLSSLAIVSLEAQELASRIAAQEMTAEQTFISKVKDCITSQEYLESAFALQELVCSRYGTAFLGCTLNDRIVAVLHILVDPKLSKEEKGDFLSMLQKKIDDFHEVTCSEKQKQQKK